MPGGILLQSWCRCQVVPQEKDNCDQGSKFHHLLGGHPCRFLLFQKAPPVGNTFQKPSRTGHPRSIGEIQSIKNG